MELWSRRKFFLTSLAGSAIAGAGKLFGRTPANGTGELSLASLVPAALPDVAIHTRACLAVPTFFSHGRCDIRRLRRCRTSDSFSA